MLIAGVIDHQLGDDADAPAVGLAQQGFEIGERAVIRMDGGVIGDVIAIVAQRRRIERQQPQNVDAQILQIVEFAGETLKITDAVRVRVEELLDVRLIDDRLLVPKIIHALFPPATRHPLPAYKKYSKSRSERTFLRIRKICAGTTLGLSCT